MQSDKFRNQRAGVVQKSHIRSNGFQPLGSSQRLGVKRHVSPEPAAERSMRMRSALTTMNAWRTPMPAAGKAAPIRCRQASSAAGCST